jgi:hypothetical protein
MIRNNEVEHLEQQIEAECDRKHAEVLRQLLVKLDKKELAIPPVESDIFSRRAIDDIFRRADLKLAERVRRA